MKKLNRKSKEGFTIIEVMIVLAIAALIMLIVFMAVPALQRSSRNNGRVNDIARIGDAINEWVSNNNGIAFTAGVGNANLASVITQLGGNSALAQYPSLAAASNCTNANSFCQVDGSGGAVGPVKSDSVEVVTGAQCSTTTAGTTTNSNTSTRSMSILYQKESGGGNIGVCTNI
jgi:prepilin-type N-terminal cleavage/methylation domain-containing protein